MIIIFVVTVGTVSDKRGRGMTTAKLLSGFWQEFDAMTGPSLDIEHQLCEFNIGF